LIRYTYIISIFLAFTVSLCGIAYGQDYTLTLSADGNGTVSADPDSATYSGGTEVTISASPEDGWMFSGWSGDHTGTDNPAVIIIDGDKTITAVFTAIQSHTVTFQTDGTPGASLGGETVQTVIHGEDASPVAAQAPASHTFVEWTGTGGFQSASNPLVVTNLTGDMTVTAHFQIREYTISATSGGNGSISPSGNIVVQHGGNQSFDISPASGYRIDDVVVDGASVGSVSTHTFNDIQNDHTIHASFIIEPPALSANPTSLSFGNVIAGAQSSSQSFTLTGENLTQNVTVAPPNGYQVSLASGSGYTSSLTVNESAGSVNQTVFVRFAPSAVQSFSGNITNTSSGESVSVGVSGTGIPLPAPALAAPANGADDVSLTPILEWNEVTEANSYNLQVADNISFSSPRLAVDGLTNRTYQIADANSLDYGTTYFWHVQASNDAGAGDWSGTWEFETMQEEFTISGSVTGATQAEVTINVTGDLTTSTTTASNGSYSISGVPDGSNVTITPSKEGYSFSPSSITIPNISSDLFNQNFTATQLTYSVSGTVSGATQNDVTITVSGDINTSTTTASNGTYTINGVPHGANITLTPSKTGFSFDPTSRALSNVTSNQTNQNFTATQLTYSVSGTVSGATQNDVTINVTGGHTATTTTASNGTYTINGVPHGANITVTPSKTGFSFTPTSHALSNVTSNQTNQNFTATQLTYSVSGTISGATTGDVTINVTGGHTASMTTNPSGNYTISGIPHGASISITPSKEGYSFTPSVLNLNNITSNQTNQNFTATQLTYSVSGTVSGATQNDVTINVTGGHTATTTTASNGTYTINGIPHGANITVTPSKTGFSFTPTSHALSNVTSNQTNQNFTATQLTYSVSGTVSGATQNDVTINVTGGHTATTTTASNGTYTINGIPHGANITVTPSKTGFSFTPTSHALSNVTSNQTNQNFTATQLTYSVSGTVSGATQNDVTINVTGGHTATTTTASNGSYTINGVPHGANITITPSKTGFSFDPTSIDLTNVTSNQTNQDFTALRLPAVQTNGATQIRDISATLNGNIIDTGNPAITQHGFVWAASPTTMPTHSNTVENLGPTGSTGAFSANISGLTPGTIYYVRAFATNDAGTIYGNPVDFTTTTPTTLVFTQQPTNTQAGQAISPIRVEARDVNNNLTSSFNGNVTIAIQDTNPANGDLSGTATRQAIDGAVIFDNLSIDKAGQGYTLRATSGSLTAATSSGFNISPAAPNDIEISPIYLAACGQAIRRNNNRKGCIFRIPLRYRTPRR
jgi:uncharacterized repeat protein (TIGR02543 family)